MRRSHTCGLPASDVPLSIGTVLTAGLHASKRGGRQDTRGKLRGLRERA